MIFELAARGQASSGIVRALNEKRCEQRNAKPWTQRQVAAILGRGRFYREGVLRYGELSGQDKALAQLDEGSSRHPIPKL